MAGQFKSDPRLSWVPVDLTVALAGATGLAALGSWFRRRFPIPGELVWMVILFAAFALPAIWTDYQPYAAEKVARLLSLTLLAAVAPILLFPTRVEVLRFCNSLALLGMVMALDGLLTLMTGSDLTVRLTAFGSSPISFGRSLGIALILTALYAIEGRLRPFAAIGAVSVLSILLIYSGSRGPLLAAFSTLALVGLLFYWSRRRQFLRYVAAFAMVALVFQVSLAFAPDQSGDRISALLSGRLESSERTRLEAYHLAAAEIQRHPFGIGWGGFATRIDQFGVAGQERQYPHNLVLETALEAGWITAMFFVCLALGALIRLRRAPVSLAPTAVFALLSFCLVNAMVSGDVNDNKELFAFLAVGLQLGGASDEAG